MYSHLHGVALATLTTYCNRFYTLPVIGIVILKCLWPQPHLSEQMTHGMASVEQAANTNIGSADSLQLLGSEGCSTKLFTYYTCVHVFKLELGVHVYVRVCV